MNAPAPTPTEENLIHRLRRARVATFAELRWLLEATYVKPPSREAFVDWCRRNRVRHFRTGASAGPGGGPYQFVVADVERALRQQLGGAVVGHGTLDWKKKEVPNPEGIGGKSGRIVEGQSVPKQSTADEIAKTRKLAGDLAQGVGPRN